MTRAERYMIIGLLVIIGLALCSISDMLPKADGWLIITGMIQRAVSQWR